MATIGKQDATTTSLENRTVDTMTGDGSDTTLALSSTPLSINNVLVFISGVMQRPTTDYTLSGSTITFSEAPLTGLKVVAIAGGGEHIGVPLVKLDTEKFSNSAVTDAKIASGISASKLTGALPSLDGSALTGASGDNISGVDTVSANDPTITTNPASVGHIWLNRVSGEMFVCTDKTVGANVWTNIGEGSGNVIPFMSATGGTITTHGDYKVHTFTTSGTFTPQLAGTVDYLVLAGGGGGGQVYYGGGGGGGGYLTATSFSVTSSAMTVTVGGGGQVNVNGQNSVFGSITSTGGGAGGTGSYAGLNAAANGKNGGSGGGGNANSNTGGTGIAGQGFAGGTASAGGAAGSGGGAGGVAANNVGQNVSQVGGVGLSSDITGTAVVRGEGGTGGAHGVGGNNSGIPVAGGGRGSYHAPSDTPATAGAVNRGGGGGGSGWPTSPAQTQGIGGSGVVIIRYQFR